MVVWVIFRGNNIDRNKSIDLLLYNLYTDYLNLNQSLISIVLSHEKIEYLQKSEGCTHFGFVRYCTCMSSSSDFIWGLPAEDVVLPYKHTYPMNSFFPPISKISSDPGWKRPHSIVLSGSQILTWLSGNIRGLFSVMVTSICFCCSLMAVKLPGCARASTDSQWAVWGLHVHVQRWLCWYALAVRELDTEQSRSAQPSVLPEVCEGKRALGLRSQCISNALWK